MDLQHITQIIFGVAITAMAFFLKRIFDQIDGQGNRVRETEIDIATLEAESREMHGRLKRIEIKIDQLLNRGAGGRD
jgi:hypothetical protein